MEENNKFDTDTNGMANGSLLYGAETEPQAQPEESGHSSVYSTEEPAESSAPTPEPVQNPVPVQLAKPAESSAPTPEPVQNPVPVQLTKPTQQQGQAGQLPPQGFYGNPVNGNQPNYNGMPMNGNPPNYNGMPVNGNQPNYNGMPMNGNPQNYYGAPMGYAPVQVPPQNARPKKRKTGLVVGILVAAVLVIAVGLGIFFSRSFFGGAKQKLARGIVNMQKEMTAYQSAISEDIGFAEIAKLRNEQPMYTDIELSFTDPAEDGYENVKIGVAAVTDHKNKKAECDLRFGTLGIAMDVANIVADDNTLYVSVPLLFDEDVYSVDMTNFGRDFNRSAWSELTGTTISEEYAFQLFSDRDITDSLVKTGGDSELGRIIKRNSRTLADATEYRVLRGKRDFEIGGRTVGCGGVTLVVEKDAYNEALENIRDDILESDFYAEFMTGYSTTYSGDYEEFKETADELIEQILSVRYEEDFVVNFYMDGRGRIVNISTPKDIEVSSEYMDVEACAIDISFTGTERTLDAIEGGIYVKSDSEIVYMGVSRQADVTDAHYNEQFSLTLQNDVHTSDVTVTYANDWSYTDKTFDMMVSAKTPDSSLELSAKGGYSNIVKGRGYTFRLSNATLKADNESLAIMSGTISVEPAEDDIEVPENATDLLKMSESEINSMVYGAMYSLYGSGIF